MVRTDGFAGGIAAALLLTGFFSLAVASIDACVFSPAQKSAPPLYSISGEAVFWGRAHQNSPARVAGGWRGLLLGIPLDLGSATFEDFLALPAVGPVTAEGLVATRLNLGGFARLEQLLEAPGIGRGKFEKLKGWFDTPQ